LLTAFVAKSQASPVGQAVFDRLLKACGEVVWKGDTTSIIVLNQIQVDAPYEPDNCEIIGSSGDARNGNGAAATASAATKLNGALLEEGSLERVKKIVAAVTVDTVTAATTAQS
jgi:Anticodon-binding domain